jgi:hypothetical protein
MGGDQKDTSAFLETFGEIVHQPTLGATAGVFCWGRPGQTVHASLRVNKVTKCTQNARAAELSGVLASAVYIHVVRGRSRSHVWVHSN